MKNIDLPSHLVLYIISLFGFPERGLAVIKWILWHCQEHHHFHHIPQVSNMVKLWWVWGRGMCNMLCIHGGSYTPSLARVGPDLGEQSIRDVIVQFVDLSKRKVWTFFSGWHHICPNLSKAGTFRTSIMIAMMSIKSILGWSYTH